MMIYTSKHKSSLFSYSIGKFVIEEKNDRFIIDDSNEFMEFQKRYQRSI